MLLLHKESHQLRYRSVFYLQGRTYSLGNMRVEDSPIFSRISEVMQQYLSLTHRSRNEQRVFNPLLRCHSHVSGWGVACASHLRQNWYEWEIVLKILVNCYWRHRVIPKHSLEYVGWIQVKFCISQGLSPFKFRGIETEFNRFWKLTVLRGSIWVVWGFWSDMRYL